MKITLTGSVLTASAARRSITGRIVTWNEEGQTSAGPTVFAADSLDTTGDVRFLLEHDRTKPLGRAIELTACDAGIDGTFRVIGTRAGDDALVEASEMLRDGLSVGVAVIDSHRDDAGRLVVTAAKLEEVSLVSHPAIDSARVLDVAASDSTPVEPTLEGEAMNPEETVEVEEVEETVDVVVEASARPVIRTAPRVEPMLTASDYIHAHIKAAQGDNDAAIRVRAADQKLADNPGIVPTPVVGNLIDLINAERPIIASARKLPMPAAGKSFERPMISTHSDVQVQATELTALASRTMKIDPITINKSTVGGSLRISFQDRDWTDPSLLEIATQDLYKQWARSTEAGAAVELDLGATGKEVVAGNAASDVFVGGIYKAAAKVQAATGKMPNVIYCAPDQWVRMGSMVDSQKRPVFPSLAPSNAYGTQDASSFSGNPLGLRLIVSNDLPDGTLIVGNTEYFEYYENGPASLAVTDVSVLGLTIGVYGYCASKVIVGGAFVEFATA